MDYVRVLGATVTETLYHDDDFEEIRKYHCRGGRGKDRRGPLKWVPLAEMSNEWLKATIEHNHSLGYKENLTTKLYEKELEYRKINGIFVDD